MFERIQETIKNIAAIKGDEYADRIKLLVSLRNTNQLCLTAIHKGDATKAYIMSMIMNEILGSSASRELKIDEADVRTVQSAGIDDGKDLLKSMS